jgi:hypothetical protein
MFPMLSRLFRGRSASEEPGTPCRPLPRQMTRDSLCSSGSVGLAITRCSRFGGALSVFLWRYSGRRSRRLAHARGYTNAMGHQRNTYIHPRALSEPITTAASPRWALSVPIPSSTPRLSKPTESPTLVIA